MFSLDDFVRFANVCVFDADWDAGAKVEDYVDDEYNVDKKFPPARAHSWLEKQRKEGHCKEGQLKNNATQKGRRFVICGYQ